MIFKLGDKVEVDSSNEEGFHGSYWEATVIGIDTNTNRYHVEYDKLYQKDLSARLRQVVLSHMVRHVPPKYVVQCYNLGDRVDAYDKDGWWVGTIAGMNREKEGSYFVFFEFWKETLAYDVKKIRMHQNWKKETGFLVYGVNPCRAQIE